MKICLEYCDQEYMKPRRHRARAAARPRGQIVFPARGKKGKLIWPE
jgi:hypothetical protein